MRLIATSLSIYLLAGAASAASTSGTSSVPVRNPDGGSRIGGEEFKFMAYMAPWQEGGEESDTPSSVPAQFQSDPPSPTRDERTKAGHKGAANVFFTRDLTKADIAVKIEGIDTKDITLFHIHCGQPGTLGPILVDFSILDTPSELFDKDGVFRVTVDGELIEKTAKSGEGSVMGEFTMGCPIQSLSLSEPVKVSTVAGMWYIAQEKNLYFNLHTKHNQYYGDIRGQIVPYEPEK